MDADGHLQVDALSLPPLPAGSNNIGDVDVLSVAGDDLLFKVKAVYNEQETIFSAAAGNRTATFSTVPSGEIWIIKSFSAFNAVSINTQIRLQYNDGSVDKWAEIGLTPAAFELVKIETDIILPAGGNLIAKFRGTTAGDDLYTDANGYKIAAT